MHTFNVSDASLQCSTGSTGGAQEGTRTSPVAKANSVRTPSPSGVVVGAGEAAGIENVDSETAETWNQHNAKTASRCSASSSGQQSGNGAAIPGVAVALALLWQHEIALREMDFLSEYGHAKISEVSVPVSPTRRVWIVHLLPFLLLWRLRCSHQA